MVDKEWTGIRARPLKTREVWVHAFPSDTKLDIHRVLIHARPVSIQKEFYGHKVVEFVQ